MAFLYLLDLDPAHRRIVVDIIREHLPTAAIYAFGSRTQVLAKPHSDVDILLDST